MEPLVQAAIVTAVAAIIGALFGLRSTRIVEQSKSEATEVTAAMTAHIATVDSWRELNAAKDTEITRLEAVVRSLRQEVDHLNAELRAMRRETRPSHLRNRPDV